MFTVSKKIEVIHSCALALDMTISKHDIECIYEDVPVYLRPSVVNFVLNMDRAMVVLGACKPIEVWDYEKLRWLNKIVYEHLNYSTGDIFVKAFPGARKELWKIMTTDQLDYDLAVIQDGPDVKTNAANMFSYLAVNKPFVEGNIPVGVLVANYMLRKEWSFILPTNPEALERLELFVQTGQTDALTRTMLEEAIGGK